MIEPFLLSLSDIPPSFLHFPVSSAVTAFHSQHCSLYQPLILLVVSVLPLAVPFFSCSSLPDLCPPQQFLLLTTPSQLFLISPSLCVPSPLLLPSQYPVCSLLLSPSLYSLGPVTSASCLIFLTPSAVLPFQLLSLHVLNLQAAAECFASAQVLTLQRSQKHNRPCPGLMQPLPVAIGDTQIQWDAISTYDKTYTH